MDLVLYKFVDCILTRTYKHTHHSLSLLLSPLSPSLPPSFHSHSSGQTVEKQKTTARKRRRNQNVEIDELATLIPLSTPLAPPSDSPSKSLVPSNGKSSAIDKISVLRLTSTFLKLQNFMKDSK